MLKNSLSFDVEESDDLQNLFFLVHRYVCGKIFLKIVQYSFYVKFLTVKQTVKQTNKQTGRQTNRQTNAG